MAKFVKKPHQQTPFSKIVEEAKRAKLPEDELFVLSLKHLDRNQGQRLHEWEESKYLADAMETLSGYCSKKMSEQMHDRFKIYPHFPPKNKTDFIHPDHVSEEANWASMHVTGKRCLIGHIVRNTFFLVFLDCDHKFWKSDIQEK